MQSILITGCSSGIGLATARQLSREGWQVVASCRKPADCARLEAEGLASVPLDLADAESIHAGFAAALALTHGRLDAVFHNGAYALPGALEDVPLAGMREIFEVNLFGWHELTRLALPVMRQAGRGRLLLCSSVLGIVAAPWRGAYVATKFALEGWADTLRLELHGSGIDVVLIEPGPIDTPFRINTIPHFERHIDWEHSALAELYRTKLLPRLYGPPRADRFEKPAEDVAQIVLRALTARSPRARYTVTTPTRIAHWMRRALPSSIADRILRGA